MKGKSFFDYKPKAWKTVLVRTPLVLSDRNHLQLVKVLASLWDGLGLELVAQNDRVHSLTHFNLLQMRALH